MPLIDVLADPSAAPADALHEGVRFRSPYADYAGRADVAHLVELIRRALVDLRIVRRLGAGPDPVTHLEMTRFEARVVTGEEVQGVLVEQHEDGQLVEAMLTLRPYAGLRAAMRAMQPLLDASPLPGAR